MSAQKEPKKTSARAKAKPAPQPQPQEYDPEIERELREVMKAAWALTYARYEREREAEAKVKTESKSQSEGQRVNPYCFDTNIYVGRSRNFEDDGTYLSSVVAMELMASADPPEMKGWQIVWTTYEKRGRLLVPTPGDWWEASKALNRLHFRAKKAAGGQAPKLAPEARHRLWNDVLIAISARRAGVTVITDNTKDFALLQSVCRVKFLSGDAFFTD